MAKKHIHITGISGFIGSNLAKHLSQAYRVSGSGRSGQGFRQAYKNYKIDWSKIKCSDSAELIGGIDAIIHCAGLAHESRGISTFEDYYNANVKSAVNAFEMAKISGAKKFIFLSSLSIFSSNSDTVIIHNISHPSPTNFYGKTKLIAEHRLTELALKSDVALTIVRIPMVIGTDAPGNFNRLMRVLQTSIPFPISSLNRQRSFIFIDSFCLFCERIIESHIRETLTLNLVNTPDVGLADMVEGLRSGLGVRSFTFKVPNLILIFFFVLLRKKYLFNKIYGSFVVEQSDAVEKLGWDPEINWDAAFFTIGQEIASRIKKR